MATISMFLRVTVFLAVLARCAAAGEAPVLTDAESLAEVLRTRLPAGWTISRQDDRVILSRAEPVELYNNIAMPGSDRAAEIKRRPRSRQLKIIFWLGPHVTAAEFKQIREKNRAAVSQANKDTGAKSWPSAEFWAKHPEYGYRQHPILDAGQQSIYMNSTGSCIARPIAKQPRIGSMPMAFVDDRVHQECQGIIDGLGEIFRPYP